MKNDSFNPKKVIPLKTACVQSPRRLKPPLIMSCILLIAVLRPILMVKGADWPQWLGPDRNAVWEEEGILEAFPSSELEPVWRSEIGGGYSGPAISNGRVFVMDRKAAPFKPKSNQKGNINFIKAHIPGTERILCLDEKTGKLLWLQEYDCTYTSVYPYAIGPRCTPTVDSDRVYTLGAEGDLLCLNTKKGDIVWTLKFENIFSTKTPDWGFAAHPLIEKEKLICMVGGKGSTVVAFNKMTGQIIWKTGSAKGPGYCAPGIHQIAGMRQLIVWDAESVCGLNPETGDYLWQVALPPTYEMSIGMPRIEDRKLFVMSFNRLSAMIEIAEDGLSAKLAWKSTPKTGIGGVMDTAWLEKGYAYGTGHRGYYTCVDILTGKRQWENKQPTNRSTGERAGGWPNVFTIKHQPSGTFFLANDHGELIMANLSPQGYKEISRAKLIEPTHSVGGRQLVWSHPAFANQRVYARNDREIICVDLSAKD
jgi:outer membrane protein assembly factor BamB